MTYNEGINSYWYQERRMDSDLNPPKFFFNFIGPESDSMEYVAEFPVTELSLAMDGGAAAAREVNLLGVMEKMGIEQQQQQPHGEGIRRRIALMRRDKQQVTRTGEAENRVGYGPNLIPVKRQMDRDPTRLMPAPTNPEFIPIIAARGKALALGAGSSSEMREMVGDASASYKAAMEEHGGSPTANPNAKKLKQVAGVENYVERVIIPKPMPHPAASGSGSGSGDVILKGYLMKGADERIRIVCMCHRYPHTPEEFLRHAGGPHGGSEPPCYVTVSRGDTVSCCVHGRG